jgi:hypothetical protein
MTSGMCLDLTRTLMYARASLFARDKKPLRELGKSALPLGCLICCLDMSRSLQWLSFSLQHLASLQALGEAQILSAPVITGVQQLPDKIVDIQKHADGDVIGFMDIRDILLCLLTHLGDLDKLMTLPIQTRMQTLEQAGNHLSKMVVKDMPVYGSDGNFLHSGRVWSTPVATPVATQARTTNTRAL